MDARAAARAVGEGGVAGRAERQRPEVVVALGLMRVEIRLHGGLVAHAERRPARMRNTYVVRTGALDSPIA